MTKEIEELKALGEMLRAQGIVKMTRLSTRQLGLGIYELAYRNTAPVEHDVPIDPSIELNFVWSETTSSWNLLGSVHGDTPQAQEPKTWFQQARSAFEIRTAILLDVLDKIEKYWERYRGDSEQFTYRLGLELAAVGTMHQTDTGWHWSHSTHKDINVYFTPVHETPEYGQLPELCIGYYRNSIDSLYSTSLSVEYVERTKRRLMACNAGNQTFCEKASLCFGHD